MTAPRELRMPTYTVDLTDDDELVIEFNPSGVLIVAVVVVFLCSTAALVVCGWLG